MRLTLCASLTTALGNYCRVRHADQQDWIQQAKGMKRTIKLQQFLSPSFSVNLLASRFSWKLRAIVTTEALLKAKSLAGSAGEGALPLNTRGFDTS